MAALLAKDFVMVHLDPRMKNGRDCIAEVRPKRRGGIPWITIQDHTGRALVTSDGPKGNVGCPVQPHEVNWFMEMMRQTAHRLDWTGLKTLEAELEEFAKKYRRPRRAR